MQQKQGESFNSFANRLRVQAKKCCFDDISLEIKKKLLTSYPSLKNKSDSSTTLNQLVSMGIAEEVAEVNFKYPPVHRGGQRIKNCNQFVVQHPSTIVGCTRCGGKDHDFYNPNCPAYTSQCTFCSKTGHFAQLCRAQKRLLYSQMMRQSKTKKKEYDRPKNVQLTVNKNHKDQNDMLASRTEASERNSKVAVVPSTTRENSTESMDVSEIQIQKPIETLVRKEPINNQMSTEP